MIFSHRHRYEPVAVEHTSPGPFQPASTVILWRCVCNAVSTARIDGKWTLSQVRGEPELSLAEASEAMLPR